MASREMEGEGRGEGESDTTSLCELVRRCNHNTDPDKGKDADITRTIADTAKIALKKDFELEQHQKDGTEWILRQERERQHGGVFADDMGLGKTLTVLFSICCAIWLSSLPTAELAANCRAHNINDQQVLRVGPRARKKVKSSKASLIVVPNIMLTHWKDQIDKHFMEDYVKDNLKHVIITENKKYKNEKDLQKEIDKLAGCNIVLLSREMTSFYKKEDRKDGQYDTLEALLCVGWERVWYDEGHEMDHRSNRFLFFTELQARASWILSGTPVDQMRGDNRNLQLLSAQLQVLKLPSHTTITDAADPRLPILKCSKKSVVELKRVLLGEGTAGLEALRQFVRCTRKEDVLHCVVERKDEPVPLPTEGPGATGAKHYKAHEENTIRNVGLDRKFTDSEKFSNGGVLATDKLAGKKCKSLLRFAVGAQTPKGETELTFSVPYTDKEIRDKANNERTKTRANHMRFLQAASIEPVAKCCVVCGQDAVLPLFTARCDCLVCAHCFTAKSEQGGRAKFDCCQAGCSVPETQVQNRAAVPSLKEPEGNKDKQKDTDFDHSGPRLDRTIKLVREQVSSKGKVVVYVGPHKSFMKALIQGLKEFEVLTATSFLGQSSKISRANSVQLFQTKRKYQVMIISEDGINGLDLSCATVLILAHPLWPGHSIAQLESRIYRMGQRPGSVIHIFTLYSPNTIEESALAIRDAVETRGPDGITHALNRGSEEGADHDLSEGMDKDHRPCLSQALLLTLVKKEAERRGPIMPNNGGGRGSAGGGAARSGGRGGGRREESRKRERDAEGGAGRGGGGGGGEGGGRSDKRPRRSTAARNGGAAAQNGGGASQNGGVALLPQPPVPEKCLESDLIALLKDLDLEIERPLLAYGVTSVKKFWKLNAAKLEEMKETCGLTGCDAADLNDALKKKSAQAQPVGASSSGS